MRKDDCAGGEEDQCDGPPAGFETDQNRDTANDFDCGNGVAECRPCRDLAECIHEISDAGTIRNPGDVKEFSNTGYDKENWNSDPADRITNIAHDASPIAPATYYQEPPRAAQYSSEGMSPSDPKQTNSQFKLLPRRLAFQHHNHRRLAPTLCDVRFWGKADIA